MSFEGLTKTISAESVEAHEKELNNRLNIIQLEYVDRLLNGSIPPIDPKSSGVESSDLGNVLDKYTNTFSIIRGRYKEKVGEIDTDKYDSFQQNILNRIENSAIEDPNKWKQSIPQIIEEETSKLEFSGRREKEEDDKHIAGLINYRIEDIEDGQYEKFGIKNRDKFISIHLDSFFKQKAKDSENIENIFSSESLQKLALDIVNKYPETKGILGESWLIGSPIGKRIGFHVYDKGSISGNIGFWGQFLDKDGQIYGDKLEKFLNTGKPEFEVKKGYIPILEFLKKYLPEDKRGKILLKEEEPFYEIRIAKQTIIYNNVAVMWSELSGQGVIDEFSKSENFKSFFETEHGGYMKNLILSLKQDNKSFNEFKETMGVTDIPQKFNDFIQATRYINKEVEI